MNTLNKSFYERRKALSVDTLKLFADTTDQKNASSDICLFACVRNESLRLDYFMKYYKDIGVTQFYIVDNGSTDGSLDIYNNYENICVYTTEDSYRNHWFWMEHLLNKHGMNRWCIMVDIDELITYPNINDCLLPDLISYLEDRGSTYLPFLLLDIYSKLPLKDTHLATGADPLSVCTYFDDDYYEWNLNAFLDRKHDTFFEFTTYGGGVRQRVFGFEEKNLLSKISLFKYSSDVYVTEGMHAINGASAKSNTVLRGIAYHTKYLSDFIDRSMVEAIREQHAVNGVAYKKYTIELFDKPDLSLYDKSFSVRLAGEDDLKKRQLMLSEDRFDSYCKSL